MRHIQLFSIFVLAAAIGYGCGAKESTTVTGPDGTKSTVSTDAGNGSVKVEGGGTSASMGGDTLVTEADLGVPFYPGSTEKPNSAAKIVTATEKNYISVRLTDDTPQKVKDFYEAKVPGLKFNVFSGSDTTTAMASLEQKDGSKIGVSATSKKGAGQTEVTVAYGLETKK